MTLEEEFLNQFGEEDIEGLRTLYLAFEEGGVLDKDGSLNDEKKAEEIGESLALAMGIIKVSKIEDKKKERRLGIDLAKKLRESENLKNIIEIMEKMNK